MKKKIIIIFVSILLLAGCTKTYSVTNEETNTKKNYTSNIMCKPETTEIYNIYKTNEEEMKIKIDELQDCKNFSITKTGYEGLWTTIFVKPLAWLVIKIGILVKNYGISIMIVGLLLRVILMPISKKSTMMSENMKKAKPDLDALERKYKTKDDKDSMMMKSQEMMAIYKKYDISPLSGCLTAFLQLPIFFAFLEAINRVPVFFEETFLGLHLGTTPLEGIKSGNYYYIILVVLIIAATYFSFKNMNASMDEAQAKQMGMMTKVMLVFISIASLSLPAAIALYWIVTNLFTIVQNIIIKNNVDKKSGGNKKWKSINMKVKTKKA